MSDLLNRPRVQYWRVFRDGKELPVDIPNLRHQQNMADLRHEERMAERRHQERMDELRAIRGAIEAGRADG